MGQIDEVIQLTRQLESLMESLGAEGRGLHEKISSMQHRLTPEQVRSLRWIATLRNKTVHESGFVINDFADYRQACLQHISTFQNALRRARAPRPTVTRPQPSGSSRSGCFIATAVYGDAFCPPVMTLKRFRDDRLLPNTFGRAFVRLYYRVSPGIAQRLSRHPRISACVRGMLDKLVKVLEVR